MAMLTMRALPAGFTEELNPILSERVGRYVERLRQAGPIRLLVVAKANAKEEEVEDALSNPAWAPRKKGPGIWEVTVLTPNVAKLTSRPDLFRWIDLGTRYYGYFVDSPAERVTVTLDVEGGEWTADSKAALGKLGMGGAPGEMGTWTTETTGAKLADLAAMPFLSSIEVMPPGGGGPGGTGDMGGPGGTGTGGGN